MADFELSMDQSHEKPSFLCFLKDIECNSANLLYLNKVSQSKIEHFSMVSIPITIAKESSCTCAPGVDNRIVNNSCSALNNACYNNMTNRPFYSKGSDAVITMAEEKCYKDKTIDKSRSLYSELEVCLQAKYPQDHLLDEEDEFAFKITEFFKSLDNNHAVTFSEEDLECFVEQTHHRCLSFAAQSPTVDRPENVDGIGNSESGEATSSLQISSDHYNEKCIVSDSATATVSTSFPHTAQILCSGHVCHTPHSGSVSHRSDSSTTSTHSFAFPILPCEWNCSPVKMPEPDPKFFYSKRTWKTRLRDVFCCQ